MTMTRWCLFATGLLLIVWDNPLYAEPADETRPNLLIIMTDDQGRWSLGEYDHRIDTPNINYMAQNGVRFDRAVSPTPVCSPARASLYTGRTASQHGIHDFLSNVDSDENEWLKDETLISEVLSASGYRVGLFGKWHVTTDGWKPQRGFDRWLTYDEREADWINQYQHSGTVYFSDDGEAISHTGVQARFLSEQTVAFIDELQGEPFAAFVNFVEPHFPFAGLPERLVARYRPLVREIAAAGDTSNLASSGRVAPDLREHTEKMAQYLAAVTLVDEQVGRLLDALMGRDLLDNTLVIFTSDHGHLTGQYGLYGKGNATVPQNLYEDSINIPLVIYGPEAYVVPGQIRNDFVNLYDIFPTILSLIGADRALDDYDGPGLSLLPLLQGERPEHFRHFQISEMGNARMVHNGRWKLIQYYQPDADKLPVERWYDLAHPLGERRSVPAPSADQQQQLRSALDSFFDLYEVEGRAGRTIWDLPKHNAMEAWRN